MSGVATETTMYLFYSDSCPHCHDMLGFTNAMEEKYPDFKVKAFEMGDQNNQNLLFGMLEQYGEEYQGVPTYFFNGEYGVGYADSMSEGLESQISSCITNGCKDSVNMLSEELISYAEGSSAIAPKVDYVPGGGESGNSGKILFYVMLMLIGLGIIAVVRSKEEPETPKNAPKQNKPVKKGSKSSKKNK